jgi:hypothetical protein
MLSVTEADLIVFYLEHLESDGLLDTEEAGHRANKLIRKIIKRMVEKDKVLIVRSQHELLAYFL